MSDAVLDDLKSQTRSLHTQLEANVDVLRRLQSPESYRQLLAAFYGFYVPTEKRLLDCQELRTAGFDIEPRRKVPLLVTDLHCLNVPVVDLLLTTDVPDILSASDAYGCLYVLEGATLGSQIIKRLLVQHLSITTENGGAFFNAYGGDVVNMWQSFRQSLSQYAALRPHARDAMIAKAKETFVKLDAWFARCLS